MRERPAPVERILEPFVEACRHDARVAAAFLSGSYARGEADEHSDVDLVVVATDRAVDELRHDRHAFVRRLGEPLFLDDFGSETTSFFVLTDGTEGELSVATRERLGDVHVGPFDVLHDPGGILAGLSFPDHELDAVDASEALERTLRWFWHELSHFTTAIGRHHLWWAAGQLEALRSHVVNLARLGNGVEASDEPYEKVDQVVATDDLEALAPTLVGLDRDALLGAGRTLVAAFRERGSALADRFGVDYPNELDRVVTRRLDALG